MSSYSFIRCISHLKCDSSVLQITYDKLTTILVSKAVLALLMRSMILFNAHFCTNNCTSSVLTFSLFLSEERTVQATAQKPVRFPLHGLTFHICDTSILVTDMQIYPSQPTKYGIQFLYWLHEFPQAPPTENIREIPSTNEIFRIFQIFKSIIKQKKLEISRLENNTL